MECSLPDAAQWHSSPEDVHMDSQLHGTFEKSVGLVWKIYLRKSSRGVHSCTAAKTRPCWKVWLLKSEGEGDSFVPLCSCPHPGPPQTQPQLAWHLSSKRSELCRNSVCLWIYVCVCVCVWEREREYLANTCQFTHAFIYICVCVCVYRCTLSSHSSKPWLACQAIAVD